MIEIDAFFDWIQVNGWAVVGVQYVYSCFVQALPEPTIQSSVFYTFLYRFCHMLAGNTNVVRKPLKGVI